MSGVIDVQEGFSYKNKLSKSVSETPPGEMILEVVTVIDLRGWGLMAGLWYLFTDKITSDATGENTRERI